MSGNAGRHRCVRLFSAVVGLAALIDVGHARTAMDPIVHGVTSFEGTRIRVDDEPVFPFGLLWFDAAEVDAYREHRLNVVYAQGRVTQYEAGAAAGLLVTAAAWDEPRVRRFGSDPHHLAWFLMDDADTEEDARVCRDRAAKIRAIDTSHPIFASINGRDPEVDRRFRDIVDIYCPYDYPLPRLTFAAYAAWLDSLRTGFGVETLWTTIQSSLVYSKHRALGFTDLELLQGLEPAQLRLLVWTIISHGVRGIFMWPQDGLFNTHTWTHDRRAEVGILGAELDALTPLLIEGTEQPGGAVVSRTDVGACRIDRGEDALVILTKQGERYHLAVDEGVARNLEIRIRDAAGASAWSAGFPAPEALPARDDGADLIVTLDALDLTAFVLVSRDSTALTRIADRLTRHLPAAARFAETSASVFSAKVNDIVDKLARLDALPPGLDTAHAAVRLESEHAEDDPAGRYRAARAQSRRARAIAALCRDYADRFTAFAAPEASIHRLTVVTLPQYFSSFDVAAVRDRIDAADDR